MLQQHEHNKWSHQSNRCKVLTGKHPHVAHSLPGLFPGENGPERQMGLSQEGCSQLCARLLSPYFHVAEFILGSRGDSEADWGRLRGVRVSHIPQGALCQGTSWALYLRRTERRSTFKSPRCPDGGCRTQWPIQRKVWVKMKRNSHSMRKLSNLGLGGRFPSHANRQNPLGKKGAVTMALVGTWQIWSEKTKSGKLFLKAKRRGPFIPRSQHPCESEQEARMLKSSLARTKQVRKDPEKLSQTNGKIILKERCKF